MKKVSFKSAALKEKMRSVLTFALAAVVISGIPLGLTSCDDDPDNPDVPEDVIWDFAPLNVVIEIINKKGDNLLNPTVDGNWFEQPFAMLYNGKRYEMDIIDPRPSMTDKSKGRFYMPTFKGLICVEQDIWASKWGWIPHRNHYVLKFGGFDGSSNQKLEMQLIVPGSEEVYEIEVSHIVKWVNGEPQVDDMTKLNGAQQAAGSIRIVLEPLTDN